MHTWEGKLNKNNHRFVMDVVVQACNSNYLGGRGRRI
jgi:hypothetical protein